MTKRKSKELRSKSQRISRDKLKFLSIKKHGFIGGCVYIRYVITVDGNKYFYK